MGAVSRDIYKKDREYEVNYPYERKGIMVLLKDYYRLNESTLYKGDIDGSTILADLMLAINGGCLTSRQRQCIALYYFAGLKITESSSLMGISTTMIEKHIYTALIRVSDFMKNGKTHSKGDPIVLYSKDGKLYKWLDKIALGLAITEPSREVCLAIAKLLSSDEKSSEMIRQSVEGYVNITETTTESEYPAMTDEQLRWADRRVSYVPEVFPTDDVIGTRRVCIKDEEDSNGVEYRDSRRKMFRGRQ